MLHEIPSHFSHSTVRRDRFMNIQKTMADDLTSKTKTPFAKYCTTRWLVRGKVIKNILDNWEELTLYFSIEASSPTSDFRYTIKQIHMMLSDQQNRLFFTFLQGFVKDFELLNTKFQAHNPNPEALFRELKTLYLSLKKRIMFLDTKMKKDLQVIRTSFCLSNAKKIILLENLQNLTYTYTVTTFTQL